MISSRNFDAFLAIVRLGIGNSTDFLFEGVNWAAIRALADQHGLTAVALDGVERLQEKCRPPKDVLFNWIGEVLKEYEQRYVLYLRAIAELARWHNAHGFKMMVLKGYSCGINWTTPEHRPCGDIDIWQFGKQKEADKTLQEELSGIGESNNQNKRIAIDKSHHHHTVFFWNSFMVENHYDFLNVHHHKSNVELESILKELGQDDSFFVEVLGERVYLPSPNLHALFLLRHSMSNFASTRMSLRQLMDWAFFARKNAKQIDWLWLESMLERFGMKKLYDIFNAICIDDLGFDETIFPKSNYNHDLKDRVLIEILSPSVNTKMPKFFLMRILSKYNRWKANEWKHRLCYKESMWSAFWSGVWSHMLKPSSI